MTITKPLTRKETEAIMKDHQIKVVVPLDLTSVIDVYGIEGMNDLVEGLVLEEGIIGGISYKVVGTDGESILVEVSGEVLFVD